MLKISKSEFGKMTPKEIILASNGWSELEKERRVHLEAVARQIAYQIYCSYPTRGSKMNIDRYWPLDVKKNIPTKEERLRIYKQNRKWLK